MLGELTIIAEMMVNKGKRDRRKGKWRVYLN